MKPKPPPEPLSAFRERVARGWMFASKILAAVFFTFVLAEALARFLVNTPYTMDETYQWRRPEPYTMFTSDRLRTLVPPKPPGEFRVLVSGGSTVYMGEPSLPDLIERELRKAGRGEARVYNYGVPSQGSGQELVRLLMDMVDKQPDLVVMYGGGNDITHPFVADPRPGYPFNFLMYESHPLFYKVGQYPTLSLLAFGSELCRHLFRNYFEDRFLHLRRLREKAGYGTPEWERAIAEAYVANLRKAAKICDAYGIAFLAFFQPMVFYKDVVSPGEGKRERPALRAHCLRLRDHVRRGIRSAGLSERVVDLSDFFDREPRRVFEDFIHINNRSNADLAERIAAELIPIIHERRAAARRGKINEGPKTPRPLK